MNLRDFIVYTAIGATAWNVILAMLGYFFYSQKVMLDKYYKEVIVIILIGLAIYILNLIYKGLKKNSNVKV